MGHGIISNVPIADYDKIFKNTVKRPVNKFDTNLKVSFINKMNK